MRTDLPRPRMVASLCLLALAWSATTWAEEVPRSVSVSGQGEVRAEPDMARLGLGVSARNDDLDAARAEVTRGVQAVLALTAELGIESKYVHATDINIQPEYDWDPQTRERRFRGYYVWRQVSVELRSLERLGTLIERAVDLGVNQLGAPALDSTRRTALERQALALAVDNARLNAEVIARAAGGKLGAARSISASSGMVPPPIMYGKTMAMAADAGGEDTYQSGEMTFTATVQATYDFEIGAGRDQ